MPVVENVYLDPDPYFWRSSPDFPALIARQYAEIPGYGKNKQLSKMYMWMSGGEVSNAAETQSGIFLRPGKHEDFRRRRFYLFEAYPLVVQSMATITRVYGAYVSDLAGICLLIYSNYLSVVRCHRILHPSLPLSTPDLR